MIEHAKRHAYETSFRQKIFPLAHVLPICEHLFFKKLGNFGLKMLFWRSKSKTFSLFFKFTAEVQL